MTWLHFREPVSAWSHFAGMLLALPAAVVMWRLGRGCLLKRVGMTIFGFTLAFCYGASWLYHSVPAGLISPFATVDHIGIYLLIAGTVTPVGLVLLRGRWRLGLVWGIWVLAAAGIATRLTLHPPVARMTFFYLFMGWVGVVAYFQMARRVSHTALLPMWIGGLCYTVGALVDRFNWPAPLPGVFGSHEIFHLFVLAGSAWHFCLMVSVVLPYQEREPELAGAIEAVPPGSTLAPVPATIPVEPIASGQ